MCGGQVSSPGGLEGHGKLSQSVSGHLDPSGDQSGSTGELCKIWGSDRVLQN